MKARERAIKLLLRILYNPNVFSRRQLADFYKVSIDTIKEDITAIKNIGIDVLQEKRSPYRYAINPKRSFSELKYLQPLTEEDKGRISSALHRTGTASRDVSYILQKLESLYDFKKLGLSILSQSELDKLDALEIAKAKKVQAILVRYRSNSSPIRNRTVEVFDIDPNLNTIQCYDPDTSKPNKLQHFRISRFDRVMLTNTPWKFESKHETKKTDVFRIVNDQQVQVHLKLQTQAYNYLVEHYPMARGKISPASEPNFWDFEAKVNIEFYGISNFILANSNRVDIIYPTDLKIHLRKMAEDFLERLQ
ncbi:MAG: WYL domain-containing protein [Bacteroidota bacterium]